MDTQALFRETFLDITAELFPHDPQARERLERRLDEVERGEYAEELLLAVGHPLLRLVRP